MDSLIMEIVICRSPTGHRYISNNNASCFIFLWLALWILPGMKDCQSKVRVPTVRTRSWSSSSTWSPNGGLSCKQHQSVCSHRTKPSTELIMKKKKAFITCPSPHHPPGLLSVWHGARLHPAGKLLCRTQVFPPSLRNIHWFDFPPGK